METTLGANATVLGDEENSWITAGRNTTGRLPTHRVTIFIRRINIIKINHTINRQNIRVCTKTINSTLINVKL